MKMQTSTRLIYLALSMVLTMVMMEGCTRAHIVSNPPAQRPSEQAVITPVPAPAESETPAVVEETYVIDSAAQPETPASKVHETDLADEPIAEEKATPMMTEATPTTAVTAATTQPVTPDAAKAAEPGVGLYYVQVGAFTDESNANRALTRLLSDGYKGSRVSKTDDGLFRVQAGAFTDEESAGNALLKLQKEYPKGFVLTRQD